MPKKYTPNEEELKKILQLYEETNNYSAVSRAIGLSPTIIKRIITESKTNDKILLPQSQEIPVEPSEPLSKIQFYYQLQLLAVGGTENV